VITALNLVLQKPCSPTKKMSDFIYDPRPIDPPDYFDQEMSNTASWVVNRHKLGYDKATKKFTKSVSQEHGEGAMKDVLQMIAEIHGGDQPENCEIFIDATQIVSRSEALQPVHYQVNYHDGHDVYWEIKEDGALVDSGTDSDEFFATAEYLMNEQRQFAIEFGTIDPTPQFLYDHSGGEAPVTADEIYARAFQEKMEAKG
jgi:hypothetical protein